MATGVPVNRRMGANGALAALQISAASNALRRHGPRKEKHEQPYRNICDGWSAALLGEHRDIQVGEVKHSERGRKP